MARKWDPSWLDSPKLTTYQKIVGDAKHAFDFIQAIQESEDTVQVLPFFIFFFWRVI
ncbi:MAG: hypothetical protein GF308_09155 [Candidatus Heimdallarchaeota archaeon]|nr:hypothetical protein [Candidatus Heimdallarchaeota archaeon]